MSSITKAGTTSSGRIDLYGAFKETVIVPSGSSSLFTAYADAGKGRAGGQHRGTHQFQEGPASEINGQSLRKVTGPATFLHNNTYLLCDTALWNVDTKIIDAIGNVKIIQEETELQSEKMVYYIDRDLAEFRGNVVQLRDKDNNILRTRNLDYNTKDSIAVFAAAAR